MNNKKVLLCILDGWGLSKQKQHNAISIAETPTWDKILQQYPNTYINTSGKAVGLPKGQMGNSEVGHMNIGTGRIIYQDIVKINKMIASNELASNKKLTALLQSTKNNNGAIHLIGLLSSGGVHSHIDHLIYLCNLINSQQISVKLHIITDGRDVSPQSAQQYLDYLNNHINNQNLVQIATISGRYYAMDRDNRWERIAESYNAIAYANNPTNASVQDYISQSYNNNIQDEFIKPCSLNNYIGMKKQDSIIFTNFRSDRMKQLFAAFVDDQFSYFDRKNFFLPSLTMTQYDSNIHNYIIGSIAIHNTLGEIIANNNLQQLRIAETEKYAHVTYFFNGGKEEKYAKENRILIPSPKVASYDQCPEMAAQLVTDNIIEQMQTNQYSLIVANYANADMVGHTGIIPAAIRAVTVIDKCLAQLENIAKKLGFYLIITADHGNIEQMWNYENNSPFTQHTTNPVPLVVIGNTSCKLKPGKLADIAPTILSLLNIEQPNCMTGTTLICND